MKILKVLKTATAIICLLLGLSNLSVAQSYQVIESYTGEKETLYHLDQLISAANNLQSFVGSNKFKVFAVDYYSIRAYVEQDKRFDFLFDKTVTDLDASEDGYLLITKEHGVNDKMKYRMHVKFPDVEIFNELSSVEKISIINSLNSFLEAETTKEFFTLEENTDCEIKVMNRLIWLLNGGLVGADFFDREVEFGDQHVEVLVDGDVDTTKNSNVFDYAGIVDATSSLYIKHLFQSELEKAQTDGIAMSVILTSDIENVSSSYMESAYYRFNTLSAVFVLWMHFSEANIAHYSVKVNISESVASAIVVEKYQNYMSERIGGFQDTGAVDTDSSLGRNDSGNCEPDRCTPENSACPVTWTNVKKWSAYCCVICDGKLEGFEPIQQYEAGLALGVFDGLLGTLFAVESLAQGLSSALNHTPFSSNWFKELILRVYHEGSFKKAILEHVMNDYEYWLGLYASLEGIYNYLIKEDGWNEIKYLIIDVVKDLIGDINPLTTIGPAGSGYVTGLVVFDVILTTLSGGTSAIKTISTVTKEGLKVIKRLGSPDKFVDAIKFGLNESKALLQKAKCFILVGGCFVKDTQVLMASNANQFSLRNSTKAMAVAAAMPIVAVPIQEVQLLDYAVAHETVNGQNNLIASTDEDLYLGLLNEDPYTSDQQRERDKYELNNEDWYSVSFEQVDGTSKCHFALHDDWIKRQGYKTEKVFILNLPEQGINGPFRVTAIKHIIPQKKPSEDAGNGYDWKPVTGLFEHQSNQVYDIDFDNGESLGVTYQHPIYSMSEGDWKLAGELENGEEVLTKSGNTKVVNSEKKEGSETVYNLEVKELHNFLVAESGILVHNNYFYDWVKKLEYWEDGVMVLRKPIDHIWDGHSFLKKKPGKSYFRERYSSRDKIKKLIEDVTNNVELGDIKKVHNSAGNVDWIIVDARKALNGASDFIGKDKNGNVTKYLKVVIDHIDNHGKIIPKTAFPIDFVN